MAPGVPTSKEQGVNIVNYGWVGHLQVVPARRRNCSRSSMPKWRRRWRRRIQDHDGKDRRDRGLHAGDEVGRVADAAADAGKTLKELGMSDWISDYFLAPSPRGEGGGAHYAACLSLTP